MTETETEKKEFNSFAEFYPYYIGEHMQRGTKIGHVIGTMGFIVLFAAAVVLQRWLLVLGGIVFAYGCAWISHLFSERNRPTTFNHPLYSLMGDFKLCFELVTGKRKFNSEES